MKCPYCGAETKAGKCEYCGSKIEAPKTEVQTATPNGVPNIIININGKGLQPTAETKSEPPVSTKSKGTAIFLCCLVFIGLGGLHRIYVGKKASGLIYLLTFGLFFFGAVADLVSLSHGTFKDSDGLPLK